MTTAPENRGGNRPTAPQNNPANISMTGGNGQSGNGTQAAKYIPAMKSLGSTGVETMAQQNAAPMYAAPEISVTPLTAPSELPDQNIMHGTPSMDGSPNEVVGLPSNQDTTTDQERLRQYLPALEAAAMMPNASDAYKNYVRIARATVG